MALGSTPECVDVAGDAVTTDIFSVTQFAHDAGANVNDDQITNVLNATFVNVPLDQPIMLQASVYVGAVDDDCTNIVVGIVNNSTGAFLFPPTSVPIAATNPNGAVVVCAPVFDTPGQPVDAAWSVAVAFIGATGPSTGISPSLVATWAGNTPPSS